MKKLLSAKQLDVFLHNFGGKMVGKTKCNK